MNNYLDKYIKYKTKYNILKLKGGYQLINITHIICLI